MRSINNIDMVCPVNVMHPLNVGRQLWLLSLAGISGGASFHDLTPYHRNGLLTAMSYTATSGWAPSLRQGSFGALRFDGSDDEAICTGYKGVLGTGAKTINIWFRTADADATAGANGTISWGDYGIGGGQVTICVSNGVAAARYGGGNVATAGSGYNDNNWHMLTVVQPAAATVANVLVYVDAVSLATSTTGSTAINTSSLADVRLGQVAAATAAGFFLGDLDDASLWNRVLSANEIAQLYQESRLGYPNLLRRVRPYRLAEAVAGNRRRRFFIGAAA